MWISIFLFCEVFGGSLFELYWKTASDDDVRFFYYQPGSEPEIDPDYENKITGYLTGMS